VVVHGLVVSSRYMVPLARALASDFPVYAPDLPGFGESSKPAKPLGLTELAEVLHAWMRTLGLPRAALLGNSFGCQIIAELAVRHPEAVERLVLQGPTVDAAARRLPVQIWRAFRNGRREPGAVARLSRIDYAKAGLGRAAGTIQALMRDRIEDKLPRITTPTLVVRGSRDLVVPQPWAEEVTRLLPNGRLVVLAGGTHTLNYTDPERLAAVTRAFLLEAEHPVLFAGRAPP
jgi:pimeloyl-ACP methyl ester carboxylesterase